MNIYKKLPDKKMAVLEVLIPIKQNTKVRLITRIQVPEGHRGKGIGSNLMKTLCDLADKEEFSIYVQVGKGRTRFSKWMSKYKFILVSQPDLLHRAPGAQQNIPSIIEINEVRKYLDEE